MNRIEVTTKCAKCGAPATMQIDCSSQGQLRIMYYCDDCGKVFK